MPRTRRIHSPGGLYHAVLRGNHRQAIFHDHGDYWRFEQILAEALERYGACLYAYCWMPNHAHVAIQIGDAPLGAVMRVAASRYARRLQRDVSTTGHLFERRYRARLVDSERYLLALVRYIHLNPVRAGLVTDPYDYAWSSHREYLGAPCPGWLHIDRVLGRFGAPADVARTAYRHFMGQARDAEDRAHVGVGARPAGPARPGAGSAAARGLDAITAEVASEAGVTVDDLVARRRPDALVRARLEVARRALLEGAANLTQIARHLGRSPSTLSCLLQRRR